MSFAKQMLFGDVRRSAWADEGLLHACSVLPPDDLERDLSISHKNILATLCHISDGERVWLDCLRTTPDGGAWRLPQGPAPQLSLAELRQKWPELWEGFESWLEGQSEASLAVESDVAASRRR